MGGGGGGGYFKGKSPKDISEKVRVAEQDAFKKGFQSELSDFFSELFKDINNRDAAQTRKKLDGLVAAISDKLSIELTTLYGGSVAKHTYVDGLSDIDTLVIVNDSELEGKPPAQIMSYISKEISGSLKKDSCKIELGKLAVTITYKDGVSIQLLPAIRKDDNLRIPSADGSGWSNINPHAFSSALTRHNEKCGNQLIPTIKLAKGINATLPEKQRLTGYHMESLAIEVFRGYSSPFTTTSMLPYYFEKGASKILKPIADKTGQSLHVDDYLGKAGSAERKNISHIFQRLSKRMLNASAGKNIDQWNKIFGI